ncbi:MAG: ATP-binding protein [Chloroflexota bacterium]
MKKALPLTLVLLGAALLITAVVFWIDSKNSAQPQNFGQSLRDWIILVAGLGVSIKGWMDLVKKESLSPPTQSNTDGGVIINGKVDSIGKDVVGRDQIITTNIISEDSPYNVEGLSNPYLGLQAFTYIERDRYAGREKLAEEALQLLVSTAEQRNLLFVTGASGSGKSSFVQASLLPVLINYYKSKGEVIKFEVFRPSKNPKSRLNEALKRLGSRNTNIIIIDQFEELFTQSDPNERIMLLDFLRKLEPFGKSHRHVIATLRSDYLGEMFGVKWLWDIAKQGIELREMRKQELKDAIIRPLQAKYPDGRKRFEIELVEKLADDTSGSVTYLPLLQVTLEQLWNKGQLKLSAYNSLTDAIKERADAVLAYQDFDKANPDIKRSNIEREEILGILLRLVSPSPDDDIKHDVRINRKLSEFTGKEIILLRDLSKARLVSIEVETGTEIVSLIHETLIQNWDVLRKRIGEKRLQLQKRVRFETQHQMWISSNRSEDYLLSKGQVAEAQELEQLGEVLSKTAQDFLRISTKKLAIEQKRGRMLSAFLDTFSAVSSTMNIESSGGFVLENAISILDADAGGLFWIDKQTGNFFLSDIVGTLPAGLLGRRIDLSHIEENLSQGIISQLGNLGEHKEFVFNSSIVSLIRIKDRTIVGFIEIINKHDGLSFGEDDQILLSTLTAQVAIMLENARLENEVQRSNSRRESAEIFGRMAFSATTNIHAFRNHLGVIRGNLQILNQVDALGDTEEKRREVVGNLIPPVMDRLNKIREILDNLRTPWQIQSSIDVDVNACLYRALDRVFPNWQSNNGEATVNVDKEIPPFKATPEMLTEAFRVVIKNAYDAIAEKGKSGLLLLTTNLDDTKSYITITIADNGIGIKPENLERIFDLRWTTKVSGGESGLGFGLFWTKDYIEGIGGSISVESELGVGAKFMIKLPITQSTDDNESSRNLVSAPTDKSHTQAPTKDSATQKNTDSKTPELSKQLPAQDARTSDTMTPAQARSLVQELSPKMNDSDAYILAEQCHYSPLAIKVAVSVLNFRPDWTPSELIKKFADNIAKFEPVESALTLSYEALDKKTRKRFRQFYIATAITRSQKLAKDELITAWRWGSSDIKLFFYFLFTGFMNGVVFGNATPWILFISAVGCDYKNIKKYIYFLAAILLIIIGIILFVLAAIVNSICIIGMKAFKSLRPPTISEMKQEIESLLNDLVCAKLIQLDSSSYKMDDLVLLFAKKQSKGKFFDFCLSYILDRKLENHEWKLGPKCFEELNGN